MTKKNFVMVSFLAVTAGLATVSAQMDSAVVASVPFSFHVGSQEFPAGRYQFITGQTPGNVTIVDLQTQTRRFIPIAYGLQDRKLEGKPQLVFNRYGDRNFLGQMWAGTAHGVKLSVSKLEKELRAKAASAPTIVAANPARRAE